MLRDRTVLVVMTSHEASDISSDKCTEPTCLLCTVYSLEHHYQGVAWLSEFSRSRATTHNPSRAPTTPGAKKYDIPGANLSAKLASDADVEVDGADPHRIARVPRIGDVIDAINRANRHAGVTAGAHILVEDGELLG